MIISRESVSIESRTTGLAVAQWTVREVAKTDDEDVGWRFQALIENQSNGDFK